MDRRVIWVLNQYASTPETGPCGRHYYLARELAEQGHSVYLISASNHHLLHKETRTNQKMTISRQSGIDIVLIRTLMYKWSSDKKRVFNWFLFSWRVVALSKAIDAIPDVVIASSPSPLIFLSAKRLSKKYGAKLIFDVRDIWPLVMVELGGYSIKNPFIQLMQWIEDRAYRESDFVSSTMPYAIDHMTAHGLDPNKFIWVPNGFDREELSNNDEIEDHISLQIPKNKFVVGYVGSIGLANALSILLKTAKLLKIDTSIVFVIVGKGADLNSLKLKVELLDLKNVVFIDPVSKQQVQSVIQCFDVCYIGWLKKLGYKFGTSPQKLPEYLFSGKPIIHSYSGRGCVVKKANAGISVAAEDYVAIKNAIIQLQRMTRYQRDKLGENGKKYAIKHYDYKVIVKTLMSAF